MRSLLLILSILITGCEIGYKKTSDSVSWVHWNEGTGKVVKQLDIVNPQEVEILSHEYAKDSVNVFYKGSLIQGADPSTFEILNESYSTDNTSIYFQNFKVKGANPINFQPINLNYGSVDESVFYRSFQINGATPSTFDVQSFESSSVYSCYLAAQFLGCNKTYVP
jgi:hypothetical protein